MSKERTHVHLLMSPRTKTVYAGRAIETRSGVMLSTGPRHDVTSDFLGVVIQYAESHGGNFEIVGDGEVYDVAVTKRTLDCEQKTEA